MDMNNFNNNARPIFFFFLQGLFSVTSIPSPAVARAADVTRTVILEKIVLRICVNLTTAAVVFQVSTSDL